MSVEFSSNTRTQNIKTLKTEPLDVLVIGGGIVGAGLIRDIALNGGIRAGLIEQGDFACGTSGASSQLIHGGFRYLAKRDIALVKQARKERETLIHIAPNLVKPIPIAILGYKGDPYPLTGIRLAAQYYNHLSKSDTTEKAKLLLDVHKIQAMVGPVAVNGLKGCVVLWDSKVDDARLTIATLKDAHRHGGVMANYVQFLEFIAQPDASNPTHRIMAKDVISGECFEIAARKIVSATGPWTDQLWCKDPSYDGVPRLVTKNAKGIHLILPRCHAEDTAVQSGIVTYTHAEKSNNEKQRAIFILPGEHNTSIVGTTETTPEGGPESARPSTKEVMYLLSEAQRIFPNMSLDRSSIIGTYAGVRPLIATNHAKQVSDDRNFVSREHIITESPSGILYVYGGKLTTHRLIAEETADYLAKSLSVPRRCKTAVCPLPSAISDGLNRYDANKESTHLVDKERLIQRYGIRGYQSIQEFVNQDATLAESITMSLPFVKAEILYAYWGEMAMTLEDLLWRRTRIGWTQGQGFDIAPQIAQFLVESNDWNQARAKVEVQKYKDRIQWLNFNL
ncbi:hypothetical protein C6501_11425 [Candidatus Poribacteria bacterium]|nr:MAG: hypothetical protein C6501_11425 [Candidatus Poribacteria bacterium]